jgi:hypothetical protein
MITQIENDDDDDDDDENPTSIIRANGQILSLQTTSFSHYRLIYDEYPGYFSQNQSQQKHYNSGNICTLHYKY